MHRKIGSFLLNYTFLAIFKSKFCASSAFFLTNFKISVILQGKKSQNLLYTENYKILQKIFPMHFFYSVYICKKHFFMIPGFFQIFLMPAQQTDPLSQKEQTVPKHSSCGKRLIISARRWNPRGLKLLKNGVLFEMPFLIYVAHNIDVFSIQNFKTFQKHPRNV